MMATALAIAKPTDIIPLSDLATRINAAHRRCEHAARSAVQYAVEAGEMLIRAKGQCEHGEWSQWLEGNCDFSKRTAQLYMRLADFVPTLPSKAQHVALLPLRDIDKLQRLAPEERDRVIEVVETEHLDSVDAAVISHRSAEISRRREEAAQSHPGGGDILTGDMSILENTVADDSADLFFTDPPYVEGSIETFGRLAELARAKLKPGGLCLTYTGHMFLDRILDEMRNHLDYWWLFGARNTEALTRFFKHKILVGWRSVLVMVKPPRSIACGWVMDFIDGNGRDKRFHEWGQSTGEAAYWIGKLTLPGGLVIDPYCGGGTIPLACKLTGRRWLATEIDPGIAAVARKRLAEVAEVVA